MLFEDRRRRSSFIDFSVMDVFLAIFSSALTFLCFVSLCQDKEMKAVRQDKTGCISCLLVTWQHF
jgi:hypothetical protein